MFYKCLVCGKVLQGLGIRPHFHYKHPDKYYNPDSVGMIALETVKRPWEGFSGYYDYYFKQELVVVCLGESEIYNRKQVELWIRTLQNHPPKERVA